MNKNEKIVHIYIEGLHTSRIFSCMLGLISLVGIVVLALLNGLEYTYPYSLLYTLMSMFSLFLSTLFSFMGLLLPEHFLSYMEDMRHYRSSSRTVVYSQLLLFIVGLVFFALYLFYINRSK